MLNRYFTRILRLGRTLIDDMYVADPDCIGEVLINDTIAVIDVVLSTLSKHRVDPLLPAAYETDLLQSRAIYSAHYGISMPHVTVA